MTLHRGNLFREVPPSQDEIIESLLTGGSFRIERIVSTGQATPKGAWYDQDEDEWVVLLTGAARLRFEEPQENVDLVPGDWILIPARRRHRVESTSRNPMTVWLAIHFQRERQTGEARGN